MPTIDLTDAERAEVTALIKRAIEEDHFPLARRLDPLRSGPGEARSGGCGGSQEAASGRKPQANSRSVAFDTRVRPRSPACQRLERAFPPYGGEPSPSAPATHRSPLAAKRALAPISRPQTPKGRPRRS